MDTHSHTMEPFTFSLSFSLARSLTLYHPFSHSLANDIMSNYLRCFQKHKIQHTSEQIYRRKIFHRVSRLSQNLNVFYHHDQWQNAFVFTNPISMCAIAQRVSEKIKRNKKFCMQASDLKPLFSQCRCCCCCTVRK